MRCETCGADLQSGARFCGSCGASSVSSSSHAPAAQSGGVPPSQLRSTMRTVSAPQYPQYPPAGGQPSIAPGQAPPAAPGQERRTGRGRKWLFLLAPVVVLGVVGAFVVPNLLEDDGGSSTQVSSSGRLLSTGSGPTAEPERAWSESIDCGGGYCDLIADGDRVYVLEGQEDEELEAQAYDAGDGASLWRADVGYYGTLELLEQTLIATGYDSPESEETTVSAFDPSTGEERWSNTSDGSMYLTNLRLTGAALVQSYTDEGSGEATALELDDGSERWTHDGYVAASCGDTAYVVDDGDLVALDGLTGDQRWSEEVFREEEAASVEVACAGSLVATLVDGELSAYDDADGNSEWKVGLDDGDWGAVFEVIAGQVVVAGADQAAGYSLDDGSETWTNSSGFDVGDGEEGSSIMARIAGDRLLVALSGQEAELIDAATGRSVESQGLGDSDYLLTTTADDLYVSDGEEVTAYRQSDLEQRWSIDVEEIYSLTAEGGRLFVATEDRLEAYR